MNINQLANSFHLDGYVYIENFFDRNLMDIYQNKILDHFALDSSYKHDNDFIKKSDTDVIPWFPQNDGEKAFDIIEQDERLINLTEAILGPGWKSLYCMVMYSNKSSNGQAWHQDCDPSNSNIFNLNRLIYTTDINKISGGEVSIIDIIAGIAINICKNNLIFPFKPEEEFLDSLIQSSIIPTEPKPTIISNTVQTN